MVAPPNPQTYLNRCSFVEGCKTCKVLFDSTDRDCNIPVAVSVRFNKLIKVDVEAQTFDAEVLVRSSWEDHDLAHHPENEPMCELMLMERQRDTPLFLHARPKIRTPSPPPPPPPLYAAAAATTTTTSRPDSMSPPSALMIRTAAACVCARRSHSLRACSPFSLSRARSLSPLLFCPLLSGIQLPPPLPFTAIPSLTILLVSGLPTARSSPAQTS